MHNYRELKVWQRALKFSIEVYKAASNFPKEEKYGLSSQLKRAAVSIVSNISEGAGRSSKLQFQNFLQISMGSSNEVSTQIEIAYLLGFISENDQKTLRKEAYEIYLMLLGLYNSLE